MTSVAPIDRSAASRPTRHVCSSSSPFAGVAVCARRTAVHAPRGMPSPIYAPRMAMERTFVAAKPDAVNRGLVGEIIGRFESKGFKLVALKAIVPSKELAETHYEALKSKPFFAGLVEFICSGPVVAMVWEGKGVVAASRGLIGATNPLESDPSTIRGAFGVDVGRNVVHGSDAVDTANREIALWFKPEELCEWEPTQAQWIYE